MARALQFTQNKLELLKNQNLLLNHKIEQDKPKVQFAEHVSSTDDIIDIGTFSKILQHKGIKIGRTRLFKWLRSNSLLRSNNEPYQ